MLNDVPCTTLGNMFLAEQPMHAMVQCSRSLTQIEIDAYRDACLIAARRGVIHVSAAISEGEKQTCRVLREEELAVYRGKPTKTFCKITQLAKDHGMEQKVENDLRSAAEGSATKLVEVIRHYEMLRYLDTANLSAKELYRLLKVHFGLSYSQRNFTIARNKP